MRKEKTRFFGLWLAHACAKTLGSNLSNRENRTVSDEVSTPNSLLLIRERFLICWEFLGGPGWSGHTVKRASFGHTLVSTTTSLPRKAHWRGAVSATVMIKEYSKFLLDLLFRWWRFALRRVCDSAAEIPYWWLKICAESSQKRWLVVWVVTLF